MLGKIGRNLLDWRRAWQNEAQKKALPIFPKGKTCLDLAFVKAKALGKMRDERILGKREDKSTRGVLPLRGQGGIKAWKERWDIKPSPPKGREQSEQKNRSEPKGNVPSHLAVGGKKLKERRERRRRHHANDPLPHAATPIPPTTSASETKNIHDEIAPTASIISYTPRNSESRASRRESPKRCATAPEIEKEKRARRR